MNSNEHILQLKLMYSTEIYFFIDGRNCVVEKHADGPAANGVSQVVDRERIKSGSDTESNESPTHIHHSFNY